MHLRCLARTSNSTSSSVFSSCSTFSSFPSSGLEVGSSSSLAELMMEGGGGGIEPKEKDGFALI